MSYKKNRKPNNHNKKEIDLFNKKLHKLDKVNKTEIDSRKSIFRDFLSNIISSLNEVIK